MPEIYIPFTKGQSEAVDPKLLPQGYFLSATNVRYSKDARLVLRNAYRAATTLSAQAPVAGASYTKETDIYIKRAAASNGAKAVINTSSFASVTAGVSTTHEDVPSIAISPLQLLVAQQLTLSTREIGAIGSAWSPTSGVCYVVFTTLQTGTNSGVNPDPTSGSYLILVKVNPVNGAIIDTAVMSSAVSTPHTNVKIVMNNSTVCLFYAGASDVIRMTNWIDSANAGTLIPVNNNVLVATAFTNKGPYFDVSPGGSSTETYLIYQSAANTMTFGTVNSSGVFAALNTLGGSNAELRPSITPTGLAPTDQIAIIWNDGATFSTGNAVFTVYRRSTSSFIVGPVNYYTGGDCIGYPVIGPSSAVDWAAGFNITGTGGSLRGTVVFASTSITYVAKRNTIYGHYLASKPFALVSGIPFVCTTDVDLTTQAAGSYYLASCQQASVNEPQVVAEWAQLGAMQSEASLSGRDPRQSVPTAVTSTSSPGSAAILLALGITSTKSKSWKLFRGEYGVLEDLLASAKLNGDLHFAGGRILTFDGTVVTEAGFSLPRQPTLTAGTAGSLDAGDYSVLVIWEWFDSKGRRHRSAPSLPTTVTVSANGSIGVVCDRPTATNKNVDYTAGNMVTARVFRTTLAQPTIYLDALGTKVVFAGPSFGVSSGAATITLADASIASNEALYTQGSAGGLSGQLQNDRPPGAKFICAGSNRLLIGGMENNSEVWFSKLRTEGEPMQWTNFAAYKAQVDGAVTAVVEMDGTWFVGTYNNWWRITGNGPGDNGADGSFDAPLRLPSNIGPISHRSCVLTGEGVIFQGAVDRMYILPRGGGDPQDIGLQVRDTLAAYPYITASAFDQQSNVAYWACCDTAGAVGRLLVYDTRLKEWFVDSFNDRVIRTLAVNNSLLRIDGQVIETVGSYQDTDGTVSNTVLFTLSTNLRPFGMSGHGRLRKIVLLGEDASNASQLWSLNLAVSYDGGQTYGDTASWGLTTLVSVGNSSFEAEHMLQYPKGDEYHLVISLSTPTPSAGCILNGMSLEVYPEAGLNRLAPAARA